MLTQAEKGAAFYALHARDGAFVIPNPWDIGTTRLLAHLGFEALATTSAGYAFSVGQGDSTIGRDETMAHVAAVVSAPISRMVLETPPRASRRPSSLPRRPGLLAVRLKMFPGAWIVHCMSLGMPPTESTRPQKWCATFRFVSH
jgi:hypothetical protein